MTVLWDHNKLVQRKEPKDNMATTRNEVKIESIEKAMMSIEERKKNAGSIENYGREVGNHESVIDIPAGNENLSGTSHPGRWWCAIRVHGSRVLKHGRGGFLQSGGWGRQISGWG